jgi:DNA repair protein RadC
MNLAAPNTQITEPHHAARIFSSFLQTQDELDRAKEQFFILGLSATNTVFFAELVSMGTLSSTQVHPREIFRPAILKAAHAIICGHNHPSGNCEPSAEDQKVTATLKEAGTLLGIPLLDHIIVSDDTWYSIEQEKSGDLLPSS